MTLQISHRLAKTLPSSVKTALGKMPPEQQAIFEEEYRKVARNPLLLQILAIFFPIQHFLEGRIGLALLFLCTAGGVGLWYLIEIVTIWGRTARHNEAVAKTQLRDMKIMAS